jgi:hypothetical protein
VPDSFPTSPAATYIGIAARVNFGFGRIFLLDKMWCSVLGERVIGVAILALGVSAIGCENAAKSQATESSNLKPLAVLYGQYTGTHKGEPPASEEEFRAYLKTVRPESLQALKVADIDSLFISSRDKKPYVIKYGKVEGPAGPGGMPVFVYEQEGVDGTRYVATAVGAVAAVDDAKFRELVPDAK